MWAENYFDVGQVRKVAEKVNAIRLDCKWLDLGSFAALADIIMSIHQAGFTARHLEADDHEVAGAPVELLRFGRTVQEIGAVDQVLGLLFDPWQVHPGLAFGKSAVFGQGSELGNGG